MKIKHTHEKLNNCSLTILLRCPFFSFSFLLEFVVRNFFIGPYSYWDVAFNISVLKMWRFQILCSWRSFRFLCAIFVIDRNWISLGWCIHNRFKVRIRIDGDSNKKIDLIIFQVFGYRQFVWFCLIFLKGTFTFRTINLCILFFVINSYIRRIFWEIYLWLTHVTVE